MLQKSLTTGYVQITTRARPADPSHSLPGDAPGVPAHPVPARTRGKPATISRPTANHPGHRSARSGRRHAVLPGTRLSHQQRPLFTDPPRKSHRLRRRAHRDGRGYQRHRRAQQGQQRYFFRLSVGGATGHKTFARFGVLVPPWRKSTYRRADPRNIANGRNRGICKSALWGNRWKPGRSAISSRKQRVAWRAFRRAPGYAATFSRNADVQHLHRGVSAKNKRAQLVAERRASVDSHTKADDSCGGNRRPLRLGRNPADRLAKFHYSPTCLPMSKQSRRISRRRIRHAAIALARRNRSSAPATPTANTH